ncbi:MAG: 30S ribosomal protein S18 [Candidatus Methylacidiphilales bacterium]
MGKQKTKNSKPRRRNRTASRRRIDVSVEAIDIHNPDMLKKFVTEKGKIIPRRITGMTAKLHRKLNREIKRARNILLVK